MKREKLFLNFVNDDDLSYSQNVNAINAIPFGHATIFFSSEQTM